MSVSTSAESVSVISFITVTGLFLV